MKFAPDERETIVRCDESNKNWVVWTSSKGMIAKLSKLCNPKEIQRDSDGVYAMTFELEPSQVSFRKVSSRKGKPLTDEQKQRMRAGRQKRETKE